MNARKEVLDWVSKRIEETTPITDGEHIIDYLCSDKSPKRLERMTYEQAKSNAEKWVKAMTKKGEHIKESSEDTETVLDFKDGFRIAKLKGKAAFEREGFLMSHCVSSYFDKDDEIYSLRDKKNMPHCTMSKDSQQLKGKGNGSIAPLYIGYVVKFLEHVGMTVRDSEMKNLGYINVEKLKKELHKDTKYFNEKYVYESEKLLGKDGKEFYSFDLLDVKDFVTEKNNNLKINFDLQLFIKLSFEYLSSTINKVTPKASVSSGDYATNASSGDYAKNASSGDRATNASSGNYAKNASSGNRATNASSGDSATNASSGNYATNASSGNYATNASSGDSAKNASSGDSATNASSGNSAKNASSGDSAKNASSGNYAKNASSGNYAKNASSGNSAKNASSGNYATNASSGDYAKNASSGNYATNEMLGNNSVSVNAGMEGKAKGKIGSWFCLSEWKYDSNLKRHNPVCVKAVQIDGKIIKEDTWYTLKNGEFTEVSE